VSENGGQRQEQILTKSSFEGMDRVTADDYISFQNEKEKQAASRIKLIQFQQAIAGAKDGIPVLKQAAPAREVPIWVRLDTPKTTFPKSKPEKQVSTLSA